MQKLSFSYTRGPVFRVWRAFTNAPVWRRWVHGFSAAENYPESEAAGSHADSLALEELLHVLDILGHRNALSALD